ncbi:MAG: hypothetical protein K9W45_01840 [Candidatus Heimdallarchaeum aukensis]|uniref:Uncharacterized protein n=1 Tax=Candidatus Heimdallarchaeum aukensis TaxID=2876573 RepID=A0A9Y1FM42_9ARCH|nr:MAG: hypothetical protein K9W45_01840 [Candidatus Heimdallarchaeum aukensis]
MDIKIFEGKLLDKEVIFGLDTKNKLLVFQSEGKFLRPRDSNKELVKIPDDFELSKIKKNSPEINKIIKSYASNAKIIGTAFNAFLNAYIFQEVSELIAQLDEKGKEFFDKIVSYIHEPIFLRNGSCSFDYFKEAKVISRYAIMDLELIINTLIKDIKEVLFNNKEPVSIFPLRYSTKELSDSDIEKMSEIYLNRLKQWFEWRKVLKQNENVYAYIIHWIYHILEALYPENQESIKEILDDANQAELFNNIELISVLNSNETKYEADSLSSVSLNKHLIYYLTEEYLISGKEIRIKEFDSSTFGWHNVLLSIGNMYTSLPIFSALNPPSNFVGSSLYEWALSNFNFSALRGNQQIDPYNLMPNVLHLFLSIATRDANSIVEIKYIVAKMINSLLNDKSLKDALSWQKQTKAAMQGKTITNAEVTEKEVEEAKETLKEIIENYTKDLEGLEEERKKQLDEIIGNYKINNESYEEIKEKKDELLKIKKELLDTLTDVQKDFLISIMIVSKDNKEVEQFANLFSVFNKYNSLGFPNDIYDYLLLIWVGSIAEKGSINWLFEKGEELNEEEEIKLLASICLKNNTVLAGYKSKQYPLIESTAPTFILQSAQNLKELIIAKDLKEEYDIYTPLLKQLKKIY